MTEGMMTTTRLGRVLLCLAMTMCVAACKKEGLGTGSGACDYGGKSHPSGTTFPATDGCNTCQCSVNGQVACTLMACLGDASPPTADLAPGRDLGNDTAVAPDTSGTNDDVSNGTDDVAPGRDASPDLIVIIDVPPDGKAGSDLAPDLKPQPDLGDAGKDAVVACPWLDASVPVGQSVSDGCNTCACSSSGAMMCTARACPLPDASVTVDVAPVCALSAGLTFGSTGGMVAYEDQYVLDPTAGLTITRTYYRTAGDGANVRTCSPAMPPCGTTGAVTIATIAADLGAADVVSAFKPGTTPLYGVDQRPTDGTVYSIAVVGSGTILVGVPCQTSSTATCVAIPAGVQRLADDLRSLAATGAATSACSNL